jgi:hypothetical protein
VVNAVIFVHSSIVGSYPVPIPPPSNMEELLVIAETIQDVIPEEDLFLCKVESRRLLTPEQQSKNARHSPSQVRLGYGYVQG